MSDVPAAATPAAASASRPRVGRPTPRAEDRTGTAPLKDRLYVVPEVVLFWAGAILLPLGLAVTIFCWVGTANTPYEYDQLSYISGGLIGLGVTFVGGFLYFGSWLAKMAAADRESAKKLAVEGRESSKRLADTLLLLIEVTSKSAATDGGGQDVEAVLVTTGNGTTMHRRDCSLIARRDDLVAVEASGQAQLTKCRVCRPEV
ncbi:MAG: hypothetical protein ACJ72O_12780 [Marmoricola sp.]